jgi:hypothetical protein
MLRLVMRGTDATSTVFAPTAADGNVRLTL